MAEETNESVVPETAGQVTPTEPATSATPTEIAAPSISGVGPARIEPLHPAVVYSPPVIKQTFASPKELKSMDVGELESEIVDATTGAELRQAAIKNQALRMSVLTGQSAHQAGIDTARINAIGNLLSAKQSELAREDAERQEFISLYGADPSQRPKGMSKPEFAEALNAGQFQELLVPEFAEARASAAKTAAGGKAKTNLQAEIMNLKDSGVSWGDAAAIIQRKYGMIPGDSNSQLLDFVYGGIEPQGQQEVMIPKKIGTDEFGEDIFVDTNTGERVYWVD